MEGSGFELIKGVEEDTVSSGKPRYAFNEGLEHSFAFGVGDEIFQMARGGSWNIIEVIASVT